MEETAAGAMQIHMNQQTATAKLKLRDMDGETVKLLNTKRLDSGHHSLQLQFEDAKDKLGDSQNSKLTITINGGNKKNKVKFEVPRINVDNRPSVAGQPAYIVSESPVQLINKRLADGTGELVWVIEQ